MKEKDEMTVCDSEWSECLNVHKCVSVGECDEGFFLARAGLTSTIRPDSLAYLHGFKKRK